MKSTIILWVSLGLCLCALSAGCTSPTQPEIKPVETTVPDPRHDNSHISGDRNIDTTCC